MAAGAEAHVAALEVFADVLSQSDGPASTDAFYGRLCEAICRLAGMERAILFRYDGARRGVRAAGAHGIDRDVFAGERFGVESAAIAREALERDEVLEAVGADELTAALPARYVELLQPRHVICTPMAAPGRWVGVILSDRGAAAPRVSPADRDLLWTLGKTAAVASVARIATSQRERALQLEQRIDLAREVHDGVIQRLFGVSLALSAADQPLDAEARARCAAEVGEALADLRALLERPLGRPARPTRTTLAAEIERLERGAGPRIELTEGDPADVPPRLDALAQSVLHEAVRNARKHARPTRIVIRLRTQGGAFVLEVVNDGVAPDVRRAPGMGLRLAAFEALHAGGVVEFGPRDDGTWLVRLVVADDG